MRFIKIVLILLTITILISCTQDNNLEKTYEISSTSKASQSDFDVSSDDMPSTYVESRVSIPLVNNEALYEQLIKKTVDIHYIVEKYFYRNVYVPDLYGIDTDIGIECFRQNNAGTYYSVHKVKQGGLLYIFYATIPQDEKYRPISQWFYILKSLSYSKFNSINEGSTIEEVKEIDPATQIFINMYNTDPDYWNKINGIKSHHYLSDGVLDIVYKYKDGKLAVVYKNYSKDFTIELFGDTSYYYDGSILPIDRIK